MAKTNVKGFTGSVTLGTGLKIGIDITAFSGEIDIDEDVIMPPFGSKWKQIALGAGSFKGSLQGNMVYNVSNTKVFDPSGSDWANFQGTVTLTCDTGCTITGTMVFSNVKFNRENGKHGTVEATMANALDDLAVTWDET